MPDTPFVYVTSDTGTVLPQPGTAPQEGTLSALGMAAVPDTGDVGMCRVTLGDGYQFLSGTDLSQLSLPTVPPFPTGTQSGCSRGLNGNFLVLTYVNTPPMQGTIATVATDGTVSNTVTFTGASPSEPPTWLAPEPNGVFAYVADANESIGDPALLYKVNLTTGVVTPFKSSIITNTDSNQQGGVLCFDDGSVLATWSTNTVAGAPILYSSAGAILRTFDIPSYYKTVYVSHMFDGQALVDQDRFVIAYLPDEGGSAVSVVNLDGTVESTWTDASTQYLTAFTALPKQLTNLIEPPIRWVRRTPHGVNELKRVFYSRFELLMDTGVGVGEDPAIYLRYSNDGSQTWSTAKEARYGSVGQTTKRVYWTPLGSARDRIFEVYGDSMSPMRIVDAYIELSPGLH